MNHAEHSPWILLSEVMGGGVGAIEVQHRGGLHFKTCGAVETSPSTAALLQKEKAVNDGLY